MKEIVRISSGERKIYHTRVGMDTRKPKEEEERKTNYAYPFREEEIQELRQSCSRSCQKERNLQRKGKGIRCGSRSKAT